jgi:hypothetical protein
MASFSASASDVRWTVTIGSSFPVIMQPAAAYYPPVVAQQPQVVVYQPPVVYSQPQVVYTKPQVVYAQPQVVYIQPRGVHAHRPVVVVQPTHRRGYDRGHDRYDDHRGRRMVGYTQVVYR